MSDETMRARGTTKTGGWGGTWMRLERPKPAPVPCAEQDRYWTEPPPEPSERCRYWMRQIERGWRPSKHIRKHCYQCAADWYGVYYWETRNVIFPRLRELRQP